MNSIPGTNAGGAAPQGAAEWFGHRSYDYRQFSDLEKLGLRKRELGLTLSAVLPCRNVAETVGAMVMKEECREARFLVGN